MRWNDAQPVTRPPTAEHPECRPLLLANATLADGSAADVALREGVVHDVCLGGKLCAAADMNRLDLNGYVLLPAPVEPHAHLDKAFTADRFTSTPRDLLDAIRAWDLHRRTLQPGDIAERARAALSAYLVRGTTAVRTHVDVGEGIGLRAAEALIGVRDEFAPVLDLQVTALCFPLTGTLGPANIARLREALGIGVDVVGGAPHVDENPRRHIELCLELAAEHRRPLDLHIDEHLDPDRLDLMDLAVMSDGFPDRVTASHAVSLGMQPLERQREVATALARAGVGVVTLPFTNLYLQGRSQPTATPRGLTAIRALLDAGVTVAAGGDNVQDLFNPIGSGDPLDTAELLVAAAHLDCSTAYELVSDGARRALGLPERGIVLGSPADLLAVKAVSLREAIATRSEQRVVISGGRVLARTRVKREYESDAWRVPQSPQTHQDRI